MDDRVVTVGEYPRWSGPVAAVAAGVAALAGGAPFTAVLAVDQPNAAFAIDLLLHALAADDARGAIAITRSARVRQPLLGIYPTEALRLAVIRAHDAGPRADGSGASMRAVLEGMPLHRVVVPDEWCRDVDTPADAAHFGISLPDPAPTDRTLVAMAVSGG